MGEKEDKKRLAKEEKKERKRNKVSLVNVRKWLMLESLTQSYGQMKGIITPLFSRQKSGTKETFEEAVDRFSLGEKEIVEKQKYFIRCFYIDILLALCILIYAVYMFNAGNKLAFVTCISLIALSLAYAFKNHFWYIQVKNRKLGCTLKDWLRLSFSMNIK